MLNSDKRSQLTLNAKKPQIALYKRLTALLLMVPKARIELARPWATAPSRQRVYQFHHFGTQFYNLFYSWAFGASGAGAASSVAVVGIGITVSPAGSAFSSTIVACGTVLIMDPVLEVDER